MCVLYRMYVTVSYTCNRDETRQERNVSVEYIIVAFFFFPFVAVVSIFFVVAHVVALFTLIVTFSRGRRSEGRTRDRWQDHRRQKGCP